MHRLTMTINGEAVDSPGTLTVVDPASGDEVGEAPDCTADQLDEAMRGALAAFDGWRDDAERRTQVMLDCADAIDAETEDLAVLSSREQGMPVSDARGYVARAAGNFRRYAGLPPDRSVHEDDATSVELSWRPVGVVAAIKPWNVPISMAVGTVAPAFRAGCPVVLKPSPHTPLVTLRLGEILRGLVPAGVLNVVSGRDPLGQQMVSHPIPRAISFTGSVATGKQVNVAAAADLKRVLLELGGNDAAIILDDADPAAVAEGLVWPVFRNAGQVCKAVKRIFAPIDRYDEIVEALAARAREIRVGVGASEQTEMGPLNNQQQLDRVEALVEEARQSGGRVVTGGARGSSPGLFYEPTVMADVLEGIGLVDEEQFGPVVPVLSYESVDEAVRRANATMFGLGASVWSADPDRAARVADTLEAGTVWVNSHGALSPAHPFGGVKWSGVGWGNGMWGVRAFSDAHVVHRVRTPQGARP
jgi:acyl-CoA reductase-like NAD-dependent aldehyde dehydrogenase